MIDRIIRRNEAARLLGCSPTSLWRIERNGDLRAVQITRALTGFLESEIQRFIESRRRVEPDRARVAAALASPRHGRAGRTVAEGTHNA